MTIQSLQVEILAGFVSVQDNFCPLNTCHGENLFNLVPFKYMSWRKSYQFALL